MAALTLRSVKGSELTAAEIDANFTNLNTDKLSSTAAGYPAIRTSLNLDFANSQSVDPRITFTRASTATRVNANGLIEVVASGSPRIDFDPATDVCKGLLIEEQRTNLLTYSEQFDNAAVWNKARSSVASNTTTAPDGTLTADKLTEDTSVTNSHYIYQPVSVTNALVYTKSIYVKAKERSYCAIQFFPTNSAFTSGAAYFNLNTGVVTSVDASITNSSISNIGNGWYRISASSTATATAGGNIAVHLNSGALATSYTGDGTSGLYIWGAQLEVGAFPTSYIPSSDTFTSRASTATYVDSNGLIQSALTNVARYDDNPVNLALAPKLLLESASTNLLTYSEQFDNAVWAKERSQINSNVIVAPDGTLTADKLVEDTQTGAHHVNKPGFVFTGGTTYCLSVYVKAAERSKGALNLGNGVSGFGGGTIASASYDLIAGTCVKSVYADSAGIQQLSGGWFRVWVVGTCTTGATDNVSGFLNNGTTTNYTGDGTSGLYIWGAQLEASSFPTSYIPTVASQATRAADISSSAQTTRVADNAVMTGTNFSSWYNQTEGAFLVNAYSPADRATSGSFRSLLQATKYATYNSDSLLFMKNSFGQSRFEVRSNSTTDVALTSPVYGLTTIKAAGSYALNNFNYCANGSDVYTDTLGNIPVNVDRLILGAVGDNNVSGNLNGHISKLSYYPKRLTNSELQALTTG